MVLRWFFFFKSSDGQYEAAIANENIEISHGQRNLSQGRVAKRFDLHINEPAPGLREVCDQVNEASRTRRRHPSSYRRYVAARRGRVTRADGTVLLSLPAINFDRKLVRNFRLSRTPKKRLVLLRLGSSRSGIPGSLTQAQDQQITGGLQHQHLRLGAP